jgi:hypothetical protein
MRADRGKKCEQLIVERVQVDTEKFSGILLPAVL